MAYDPTEDIALAKEILDDMGAPFTFELYDTTDQMTSKSFLGGTSDILDVSGGEVSPAETFSLFGAVLLMDNTTSDLVSDYVKALDNVVLNDCRYAIFAAEGRTVHPKYGDIIKNVEGDKDGSILGCAPLTVSGKEAIIYQLVVKL